MAASAKSVSIPGVGTLPVNPTPREQRRILARGHSYIAAVDLSATGISSNNGVIQNYAGFGLYLMHQQTPANTILEVRFDQDFGNAVAFRRGTIHRTGPDVTPNLLSNYFGHFWTRVVQSGDTTGTAYFLVLGTPEADYWEDPVAVPYQPTVTTTTTSATIATVLASIQIPTAKNLRLYVNNQGATALVSAPIEISIDGTFWEQVMTGTFDTLAASTPLSVEVPKGVRYLRVRAATASSSTSIVAGLVGTMG